MANKYNIYDTAVTVLGVGFTLENFQTILGIIIGLLTLTNILIKMGFRIKDAIEKKKYEEISKIIDDGIEDIKEVKDNAKNK